ncbi:hypothetical protein HK104_004796 [Borealophlyctis nickersoniae]|nr:hypothetical protein HK104_004796 [Borealophlyctis nickersoniae]
MSSWEEILARLQTTLPPLGFDLIQPYAVQRYNRALAPRFSLPTFGRASTFGVVIGNTKKIWDPFIAYLAADPEARLEQQEHPLNAYAAKCFADAVRNVGCRTETRYPDDKGAKFVAFQPLAHEAGLAYYNQTGYLCIHRIHGPWLALRATIIFDMDGPGDSRDFAPLQNPNPAADARIRQMLAALSEEARKDPDGVMAGYRKMSSRLLEVRDVATEFLGEEGMKRVKYTDEQLRYHYSKDKAVLREAVARE